MAGRRGGRLGGDEAEAIGIAALQFLAADADRLSRFLALSGLGPETIRAAATQPRFLAGVLAHIAEDESMLHHFAAEASLPPERIGEALTLLEGRPRPG
jgi:hypothetical protein